ncbi:MAG: phenylacetate--CoA ligase [Propionibacteriaceae bacterium]|nr:phenylacetate--CoA ligase [Propionibacteriaceae bacterium]
MSTQLTPDKAGGSFLQPEIETLPQEQIRELQLARLKEAAARVYPKVPFYRKSFDELGVKPEDIQSLEDVAKLPTTTKPDLRENYPFDMFAVPFEQIERVQSTSGTTGAPTTVAYTHEDVQFWGECTGRGLAMAGVKPGEILQNSYGYGLFTGGPGLDYGAVRLGCIVIPMSGGNTDRQIRMMMDLKPVALSCTPSYALHLAEVFRDRGIGPDEISLRVGIHGAEPWTNEMRAQVEAGLGETALDIYGLTEMGGPGVSIECLAQGGMHINEDHYYAEILDPVTLQPLPDGELGEIAFTTLRRQAQPLIRYRTRDLCTIIREPCACGRTFARMSKPIGRSDDMLIIRGVNVFPSQIEEVLVSIPQIEPHYQIVVDRVNYLDVIEVWVEVGEAIFAETMGDLERFQKMVQSKLYGVLNIKVDVKLKEPKSIRRSEGKAVRVIDKRK